MTVRPNYYWYKTAITGEPENAALSPENSFILDAVTVFPSVLLECTAKFAAEGSGCGLHIHTCIETAVHFLMVLSHRFCGMFRMQL